MLVLRPSSHCSIYDMSHSTTPRPSAAAFHVHCRGHPIHIIRIVTECVKEPLVLSHTNRNGMYIYIYTYKILWYMYTYETHFYINRTSSSWETRPWQLPNERDSTIPRFVPTRPHTHTHRHTYITHPHTHIYAGHTIIQYYYHCCRSTFVALRLYYKNIN